MNHHEHRRRDFSSRGRRGGRGGRGGRFRGGRGGFRSSTGRGDNHRGNRFQESSSYNVDPKVAVLRDLLQMVSKVGALSDAESHKNTSTAATTSEAEDVPGDQEQQNQQRAIVRSQAANIQLLAGVVCGSSSELFLQHESSSRNAEIRYGPMAVGVVHAAAVYPLQTPVYAALTLAIAAAAAAQSKMIAEKEKHQKFTFAHRTIQYCTHMLSRDLDLLLLDDAAIHDRPRTVTRCRLLLRYLCMLSAIGVVVPSNTNEAESTGAAVVVVPGTHHISVSSLLETIVQAAVQASNSNVGFVLADLVLSTIPYIVVQQSSSSVEWIQSHLIDPMEELMSSASYQSEFAPGIGSKAILLKEEQLEDIVVGDEEESDDEDNDDVEDASGQVCDSLQDLWRTVKHYLKEKQSSKDDYRFALFSDAPWKELKASPAQPSEQPQEGSTEKAMEYTGDAVGLGIFPTCKALTMLLNGQQDTTTSTTQKLCKDGIVTFGRLPIFGPPPDLESENDDDDDDDMEEEASTNQRLQSYQKQFGLTDRYFIAEAVRDLLLCHESTVSDTGVERGSAKTAAEQVWSIRFMIKEGAGIKNGDGGDNDVDPATGIEYAIVETILSLVVQCGQQLSAFDLVYLSRVLLELTRLEPAIMSPAIALAVSNLFEIYMPALTPAARYNLSRWFAIHLENTDYQWPAGYWKHWEPYVLHGWRNSRGAFVKGALEVMVENLSNPELLVLECLPKDSALGDHLIARPPDTSLTDTSAFDSLQAEVSKRIEMNEDPAILLSYLVGDEVRESMTSVLVSSEIDRKHRMWWRIGVFIRALVVAPAGDDLKRCMIDIEKARAVTDENGMQDCNGGGYRADVLAQVLDAFSKYKSVMLGVLAKDTEAQEYESDFSSGAVYLLEQLESAMFYNRTLLDGCIQSFLQHKFVTVENVLKWLLGDVVEEDKPRVFLRWWELAAFSIRQGMIDVLSRDKSNEMAADGEVTDEQDSSPTLQKAKAILLFLDPLLSYTVRRVGTMLINISDESKGSKFAPEQVDLLEGFKFVVTQSQAHYLSLLRVASGNELHDAWTESAVAGPKLASLLDVGASPAVDLLRKSLERM